MLEENVGNRLEELKRANPLNRQPRCRQLQNVRTREWLRGASNRAQPHPASGHPTDFTVGNF
jgi:hypothetical protein